MHRRLPRLAPHLPLPVSEPLAQGEPGEGYPYRWSVYRLLPAWLFLPASAREAFREAVGTDDATWARGRGRARAGALPVPDDPYFRDHPDGTAAAPDQLEHLIADHRQENA
ncbi:hypothetical protein [Streptomyces gossypiisoli]|uniref:hypothetical protein n=1 Tax=Streptomyces gossypiisoli TaxID=2748864 RepID=UPI0038CD50BA